MLAHVGTRYVNGKLLLFNVFGLPDGCKVVLEVTEDSSDHDSQGSWLLELVDEVHGEYPPETWEHRPRDLVRHKKHYLYGHP